MLILTRRIGDTVVIGKEVYCTLLEMHSSGQIKLGFDAPLKMPIHRYEIHKRIMANIEQGEVEHEMHRNEAVIERLMAQFQLKANHK